ncbi:hypothetical protein D3C86_1263880 [compost metagenome]
MQDRAQRVVDLVGHAGGQTTHRKHFLRLHHHLFQGQALGDVVDPDHHATPGTAHQRIESQGVVAGFVVLEPGDSFDLGHRMLLDRFLELRQKRLERFEGKEDGLVQGFIEASAGQGAGLLVPLRHVELFVEGDQRRRHGVDDAVEVVLETGELFLDLAAHLHFELQFAVGMAGFFRQTLGLVVGCLGVVPGPLELLLPGLDPRKHGIERLGEAADFIVVSARSTQCIVFFTGYLPGQLLELVDRPGNQALDLAGNDQPQQHAEDQNPQAGRQGPGVERNWQFARGHQQQVPWCRTGAGQGDDLVGTKLGGLPVFDMPETLRQFQVVAMLQLRQSLTLSVIQGRRAQRRIAVEFIEQALGALR